MTKDRGESLKQRAIEAYRSRGKRDAAKAKKQFQRMFAVEPDHVSLLNDDNVLIKANGLLIRSWLTASKKRWYALVSRCIECRSVFDCASAIGRADFGDLVGLGKAIEALGENYKAEIVCDNCMRAYRE